ncbi:cation transporter [Algoriphagus sp. AGSA1]|jgi:Co/Zn/Cd efflux system component|uniref:cation transporter n=1 Tax=Algoriphagus sp. AGSA1 TaxID=2907213 RepID=UPI001F1BA726|nr:cation transporter [Algoriphagus sp. AGSA1]MCE7056507.1 cation transporter [Algoriphagus sp. AGSA1]|tara:strand:+ start:5655 stop:6320 length:666 start_codon:yes stop_codon:yes gene_type:complete
MSDNNNNEEDEIQLDASNKAERKTLKQVLGINMFQVALAGIVGFIANSTGLLGAALDNLADSAVYLVSIYAVGKGVVAQSRAANLSGVLLIGLGLLLLGEVIRRFVTEAEPIGWAMIITAIVNAASNLLALRLLKSQGERGVHMKASMVFTSNDMLVNLGIVLSGVGVMVFNSPLPDLIISLIVVGVVLQGGWKILKQAQSARRKGVAASEYNNQKKKHRE